MVRSQRNKHPEVCRTTTRLQLANNQGVTLRNNTSLCHRMRRRTGATHLLRITLTQHRPHNNNSSSNNIHNSSTSISLSSRVTPLPLGLPMDSSHNITPINNNNNNSLHQDKSCR